MKNKGFTLAELMGVIVILGILLLLVIPNVIKNIKNAKEEVYNTQINTIKMALENWKENNKNLLPEDGETIYLTIGQLKREGFIDNDIKDPKTGKMWPNDMLLSIENDEGYQYSVLTNTGTTTEIYKEQTPSLSFDTGDVVILKTGSSYKVPVIYLNKPDGTKQILVELTPTITGSGNAINTTYAGVFQVKYSYSYAGIAISAIHNVIVRDTEPDNSYTKYLIPDTTLYLDGTAVFFNPNTGQKCTETEANANINTTTSSPTGIKNGCMRWYTFGDKENETEIRLILEHNTTPLVAWNSIDSDGRQPNNIITALNSDIVGWKKSIRQTARLITANEIAHITHADEELRWNSNLPHVMYSQTPTIGENSWSYYFDGKKAGNDYWKTAYALNSIKSDYSWLFDYTYGGMTGCRTPDDNKYNAGSFDNFIYGYWTSTPITGSPNIWSVYCYGQLIESNYLSTSYGVRPVITISKALIK